MGVTKGAKTPADVAALEARVDELEKLAGRIKRLEARVRKLEKPDEGTAE